MKKVKMCKLNKEVKCDKCVIALVKSCTRPQAILMYKEEMQKEFKKKKGR